MTTGRTLATVAGIVWTMVGVAAFVAIVGTGAFTHGFYQLGFYQLFGLFDSVDLGAVFAALFGLGIAAGLAALIVALAGRIIRRFRRQ